MDIEDSKNLGVHFDTPRKCSYFPDESRAAQMATLHQLPERGQYSTPPQKSSRELVRNLIPLGFLDAGLTAQFNACASCKQCVPARINIASFAPSRSQRRIIKRNQDLTTQIFTMHDEDGELALNIEHFRLFNTYARARHPQGSFSCMSFEHFKACFSNRDLIAESRNGDGKLMNCTVLTAGDDYIYGVNFFYDVKESKHRSLGKYAVLTLLDALKDIEKMKHFYIGSVAQESPKLSYKTQFSGLEIFTDNGWEAYNATQAYQTPHYSALLPQDVYWPYRNADKVTNG